MSTIPVNKRPSHMDKPSPIPHTRVDDEAVIESMFSMGKKLGQGSFGIVREAVDINTGKKWAVKAVNKEKAGSSAVKLLEREVSILKRVNHHHIIHLEQVFETSKKMYLVMELCEHGEIADMLKTQLYFKEDEARKIIGDLASAISYLHKNDIVHRDLKLENILVHKNEVSNDLHIKVTDFGLSVVKDGVGHESMMQQFCGTPIYMPPEIVDNKTYSQQCDVWAMGVITYYLLAGSPPFRARDEETLYEYIKKGEINFKENYIRDCSPAAHQCIQGMLKVDPAHRFTASEVLNHQWITGIHNGTTRGNVLELMKQWKDDLGEENEFERSETTLSVPVESIDQISHCNLQDGPAEKSPHKATKGNKSRSAGSRPLHSGNHNISRASFNFALRQQVASTHTNRSYLSNTSAPSVLSRNRNSASVGQPPSPGSPLNSPEPTSDGNDRTSHSAGKKTSALTSLPSSQKSNTAVRKKADKSPPSQTMKPINRK